MQTIQIITFYEFREIDPDSLPTLRDRLRLIMLENSIKGTIILAEEGFNSTVSGLTENVANFIVAAETLLETRFDVKSSTHERMPFRRIDVKIKPEIVTLKRKVDMKRGVETYVTPQRWNEIISDPETLVLDTRNDYEFRTGSFKGAINPSAARFSDLPLFVQKNLDPQAHKRIAMFCTGGIRCEKFAPFMKGIGFEEVYQLKGGILNYLENTSPDESLWEGECFVFDDRISVDRELKKGRASDLSQIPE